MGAAERDVERLRALVTPLLPEAPKRYRASGSPSTERAP
jgi:hypothetical protein